MGTIPSRCMKFQLTHAWLDSVVASDGGCMDGSGLLGRESGVRSMRHFFSFFFVNKNNVSMSV